MLNDDEKHICIISMILHIFPSAIGLQTCGAAKIKLNLK